MIISIGRIVSCAIGRLHHHVRVDTTAIFRQKMISLGMMHGMNPTGSSTGVRHVITIGMPHDGRVERIIVLMVRYRYVIVGRMSTKMARLMMMMFIII